MIKSQAVRIFLFCVAAYALFWGVVVVPDDQALRRLGRDLQEGETAPARFPYEYFQRLAPAGANPEQVIQRFRGYGDLQYYRLPIASGDSVIVQRFVYPLVWYHLNVDVEYRDGVVWDLEMDRGRLPRKHRLSASRAFEHLRERR